MNKIHQSKITSLLSLSIFLSILTTEGKSNSQTCDKFVSAETGLSRGQSWSSCTGYTFTLQTDGNLVLYAPGGRIFWATGTEGSNTERLTFQRDGNLVLYAAGNKPLWASNTLTANSTFVVQADGNLVIYTSTGKAIWALGTVGKSTGTTNAACVWDGTCRAPNSCDKFVSAETGLSRGQSWVSCTGYKFTLQADGNLVLYAPGGQVFWATGTAGSQAERLTFQRDGNLVLYAVGNKPLWASNTLIANSTFVVQADGNLVIYTSTGKVAWALGTAGKSTGTTNAACVWDGTCRTPSVSRDTPFLPFDSGVTLEVTQGYEGSLANGSHTTLYPEYNRYAVDFGASGKRVGVRASRYGQVVYAGWKDGGYGYVIVVRYNDGKYGRYLHLQEISVRLNDWVAGGQRLGLIGQTGNADGPHLHYAEALSDFGICIELPKFADAPNANFKTMNFSLTSGNPDGRR
jgi:Peptidase family M23